MASVASKLYSDDVSLLVLLFDTNSFFWSTTSITFSQFISHVLAFLNAFLGLNQLNQVVGIATGYSSCDYIYDSSLTSSNHGTGIGMPKLFGSFLENLENFVTKDEKLSKEEEDGPEDRVASSLLSGSLSMALCYTESFPFWTSTSAASDFMLARFPRWPGTVWSSVTFFFTCNIFSCFSGLMKGFVPMNSIFSAQRLMVPIDSCYIGTHNSAFLQQASYITGGAYHKPQQLDGLFQYLMTIIATDLHSHGFVQLPKPVGVDFRASCFCHKKTIDMGYICSVCLSIFCEHHKKCSTCGSVFGQSKLDDVSSVSDKKRKTPDT